MWVVSLTLARCEAWVVRLAEEASGCLKVKGFYEGIHGHVPMRCQGGPSSWYRSWQPLLQGCRGGLVHVCLSRETYLFEWNWKSLGEVVQLELR